MAKNNILLKQIVKRKGINFLKDFSWRHLILDKICDVVRFYEKKVY